MTQDSPEFWKQTSQQFQQTMTDGWAKALQSLQNMDLGAAGAALTGPDHQAPPDQVCA